MTGEEVHLAVKGTAGPNGSLQNGTGAGEIVCRFKDGSGFIGKFAGMTGSAAGIGPAPAAKVTALRIALIYSEN
jgi:hypothetical protein